VGLIEAYADREKRGFNWNNMMLHRWTDPDGVEHRVLDDYNRNVTLVDLTAQPDDIKQAVDECIREGLRTEHISNVGFHFMKFCSKYDLNKVSEQAQFYAKWLNESYKGALK
jgi:hypothetical protein